jgi:hypothetical protein
LINYFLRTSRKTGTAGVLQNASHRVLNDVYDAMGDDEDDDDDN